MANAFFNVGSLIASLVPLAALPKQPDPSLQTQLTLGVADPGNVPDISVWDGDGIRMTQMKGSGKKMIGEKYQSSQSFSLDNTQNGHKPAKPEYLSIVMTRNDAICLALVVAGGDGSQWTWTGDMGYTCGAQWYQSSFRSGGSNVPYKCVWLDANHSLGIIAKGLTLQIPDFSGDPGLLAQYKEDEGRLCQNTARMTFHPEISTDSLAPIFSPSLKYEVETNLGDPTKPYTAGALTKPDQGKDRKTRAYPDGTDLTHLSNRRRKARDLQGREAMRGKRTYDRFANRLTISHLPGHSAKELCEDKMSLGPDFVSKEEGMYCDMETSTLWPVCTATQTTECFDLDAQTVKTSANKRDAPPAKTYLITEEWE